MVSGMQYGAAWRRMIKVVWCGLMVLLALQQVPGGGCRPPPHHRTHTGFRQPDLRELWLDDFTKDFLDEMQSDGTGGREGKVTKGSKGACPPPFQQVPRNACHVRICRSDTECLSAGHKCCNNGCTFTCMAAMPPPPLVDWKKEPLRKDKGGISWLLPSTNRSDDFQAEHCSTSHMMSDEDMLLCPHGFVCHIEFLGNIARSIPNRGRCVPDVHDTTGGTNKRFRIHTENTNTQSCRIPHRGTFSNGATFMYEHHRCTCQGGSVECHVGRARG